ncbi:hypothetical protein SGLAM104S_08157 [Streptomyces glaucescens]
MMAHGMWVLDGDTFEQPELLPTGKGCHGLYVGRDSREMYVSNRGEGTVSVFDFTQNKLTKKWRLPNSSSPDMGGVSADGKVLWLSGRYDAEVYAIRTPAPAPSWPASPSAAARTASPSTPAGPLLTGPHRHLALARSPPGAQQHLRAHLPVAGRLERPCAAGVPRRDLRPQRLTGEVAGRLRQRPAQTPVPYALLHLHGHLQPSGHPAPITSTAPSVTQARTSSRRVRA